MLNTDAWCRRTSASNADESPSRARRNRLMADTASRRSLFCADPGNAKLSFEFRELVEVDVAHDVDDGEGARFAGDHGEAEHLAVVRVEENSDVGLGFAFVDLGERAPAWRRELLAHRVHVVARVGVIGSEIEAANTHGLAVLQQGQGLITFAFGPRKLAGQPEQKPVQRHVYGFDGFGAQVAEIRQLQLRFGRKGRAAKAQGGNCGDGGQRGQGMGQFHRWAPVSGCLPLHTDRDTHSGAEPQRTVKLTSGDTSSPGARGSPVKSPDTMTPRAR